MAGGSQAFSPRSTRPSGGRQHKGGDIVKIRLSAPAFGGYTAEYESESETQERAAAMLGVSVTDLIEIESPDGSTTYLYATQAAADSDRDGAYAI